MKTKQKQNSFRPPPPSQTVLDSIRAFLLRNKKHISPLKQYRVPLLVHLSKPEH